MKLKITTEVTDQQEITDWIYREGILKDVEKQLLLKTGRLEIKRTEGSSSTYELTGFEPTIKDLLETKV